MSQFTAPAFPCRLQHPSFFIPIIILLRKALFFPFLYCVVCICVTCCFTSYIIATGNHFCIIFQEKLSTVLDLSSQILITQQRERILFFTYFAKKPAFLRRGVLQTSYHNPENPGNYNE